MIGYTGDMSLVTHEELTPVRQSTMKRRLLPIVSGLAVPLVSGLLMAVVMPRGPVTPGQVIVFVLVGVGVGVTSGWLLGRWALLAAPVLFALTFELGRIGFDAPSLDGIHLESTIGIVLFVTGRLFHGLVVLIPMIWGAAIGSTMARRAGEVEGTAALPKVSMTLLAVLISRWPGALPSWWRSISGDTSNHW